MNDFNREVKNISACKVIPTIRRVYQSLFYLSVLFGLFIFLKLLSIDAAFFMYIVVIFCYIYSYAILLVLRALEHSTIKIFYLESELTKKGILEQPPFMQEN